MGAIGGEELVKWEKDQGNIDGQKERILVLVRLRPLSEELSRSEVSDWECINENTILCRNSLQERSGLPTAYSFDRVFRGDCPTKRVYEEGTKDIALSVVAGINSCIFAYGQTSSGKTYTMNGITEYTFADIYDYTEKHEERAFVLKFSAMEIYNEVVRDLLSTNSTPLRLLDDPDKGTIIERLTEESLRDWDHLKELLSICEAQRQVGETSLNEKSSRSHQILRLTIESSAREYLGKDKSTTLTASVNFVDLAGSERASQALSAGQRLKEGCHINRSLLTLGTVIRKLSKGGHGHVNYRDSKLTRILQPALGGNARTAIICTLNPARNHVEQSRNTLLFASCAKEVTTKAQVNVVMSDKALVKHLQREVARLESELRTPGPASDYVALLRNKDLQIEKLENEVRELIQQRDLAHARLEELSRRDFQENTTPEDGYLVSGLSADETSPSLALRRSSPHGSEFELSRVSSRSSPHGKNDYDFRHGEDSDSICKEVRCIEFDDSGKCRPIKLLEGRGNIGRISELDVSNTDDIAYQGLVSSMLATELENGLSTVGLEKTKCNTPEFDILERSEATPPHGSEKTYPGRPESVLRKHWNVPLFSFGTNGQRLSRSNSQSSNGSHLLEEQKLENVPGEGDIPSVDSFVAGLKEMAKSQFGNQIDGQVQGIEQSAEKSGKIVRYIGLDPVQDSLGDSSSWQLKFQSLQRSIVELWQTCNVSLIHRTYFFLLFRGDPMDSIYMEVEHRRLSFLRESFFRGPTLFNDDEASTMTSSLKELLREKQMLSRLVRKRLTNNERNRIYQKWGIRLNSKQRKLQLVQQLWSKSEDMEHVSESAAIVAKLIRFSTQGQAIKEMFGLSFSPPGLPRRSFSWKNGKRSLV